MRRLSAHPRRRGAPSDAGHRLTRTFIEIRSRFRLPMEHGAVESGRPQNSSLI
jgi:hypothetical protein